VSTERGETSTLLGGHGGAGRRPGVVVVDATVAFTQRSSPLCCDEDGAAVRANVELLGAARAAGVPIVFSAVVVGPRERHVAAHFLRKMPGLETIAEDPQREEVDPRLERRPEEPLLKKIFPSVFFDTELAAILTGREVDTVIITGMSTSGCVRATAVDALQHGFRPLVVRDAVADRDPVAHENALRDLELKYADVVSTQNVVAYLAEIEENS
jgi:maleamate amidohydrolase